MSLAKTDTSRTPQDLSHLIFTAGKIGELMTLSCIPVIAGDSYQDKMVGSLKFSPMRRNLTLDPKVEIFSFYVPHRHVYGDEWVRFMKDGLGDGVTPNVLKGELQISGHGLTKYGISRAKTFTDTDMLSVPTWRARGHGLIVENYFIRPNSSPANRSYETCHLKNMWTAPLSDDDTQNVPAGVAVKDNNVDFYDLHMAAATFNSAQKRVHFASRYRDIIDSFGGKTTADVDQRPTLLAHTQLWGSGYDVDGTSETSLGQFTGRVNASFEHNVPRFFCSEHGAIWTLALVRFPVVCAAETHFLNTGEPTYADFAADPVAIANSKPVDVNFNKIFPATGEPKNGVFRIPHSQWYREHPNFVAGDYDDLQGYPFLTRGYAGGGEKPWELIPNAYEPLFQTNQLKHWQIAARSNAMVLRNMPTARQSLMLDPHA